MPFHNQPKGSVVEGTVAVIETKAQAEYKTANNVVLTNCKLISLNFEPIFDSRHRYADQDNAPKRTRTSPVLNDEKKVDMNDNVYIVPPDDLAAVAVAVAGEDAKVKTMRPHNAITDASHTFFGTLSPNQTELMTGVRTTLVCVRNDARALLVVNRPTFNNPWERKFHTASSNPT
mmetsp:Transcript_61243/g.149920  ORF Transcript_61243/g.149920 Transcript_61243/m.149920 type:complete len:175 (+) Transcript_61243:331-855(+)